MKERLWISHELYLHWALYLLSHKITTETLYTHKIKFIKWNRVIQFSLLINDFIQHFLFYSRGHYLEGGVGWWSFLFVWKMTPLFIVRLAVISLRRKMTPGHEFMVYIIVRIYFLDSDNSVLGALISLIGLFHNSTS